MKKILLGLIIALGLNANSLEDSLYNGWSNENQTKFYYYLGLQIADVLSTNYVLNTGRGVETNPLLGTNPSLEKLLLFKAIAIPLTYYGLDSLDNKWKGYVLNTLNVVYLGVVGNNLHIGFRTKF